MGTVTKLKSYPRGRRSTKLQQLAQQRNWCCYMLKGMAALTEFMYRRGWLSETNNTSLTRAIKAARFSVEHQYYVKREEQGL